ncbi:SMI1/KNR4 family protein [uncultured Kordia sp.]|uniref:SMI1/KNR4 family protein n=1 Tax=uncultured Kordia sp. TaxID=507699 RepID=UPI0026331A34|nr:SMI1/KNR4 family protein [uncultured Kordia sp.]
MEIQKINQVERIKIKLRLAKMNDTFLEVFGASSHNYVLNKPLSQDRVKEFENEYNILFPNEYKVFLTEIGNGGLKEDSSAAGPFYGIFPLENLSQMIEVPKHYLQSIPFLSTETTFEEWDKMYATFRDTFSDEEYENGVGKMYAGVLNIGARGCSGYIGIMLHGKDKGRIIHTYDEMEYPPGFVDEINFLDWYESWLDAIISGEKIMESSLYTIESEESCIKGFLDRKEHYWKLVSLAYIRSFKKLSDASISVLWNRYKVEKDEVIKLYILNLLTKYDYTNIKKELILLSKKPIDFLRNLHLYAKEKTSDWIAEIKQIETTHSNNIYITEYITFITKLDLKNHS